MSADILYMKDSLVDVTLVADHFAIITTLEITYNATQDEIENQMWEMLTAEYGTEWVNTTRTIINKVSMDVVPERTINDIMKSLAEEEPSDE
jgi:hypothetical protein